MGDRCVAFLVGANRTRGKNRPEILDKHDGETAVDDLATVSSFVILDTFSRYSNSDAMGLVRNPCPDVAVLVKRQKLRQLDFLPLVAKGKVTKLSPVPFRDFNEVVADPWAWKGVCHDHTRACVVAEWHEMMSREHARSRV